MLQRARRFSQQGRTNAAVLRKTEGSRMSCGTLTHMEAVWRIRRRRSPRHQDLMEHDRTSIPTASVHRCSNNGAFSLYVNDDRLSVRSVIEDDIGKSFVMNSRSRQEARSGGPRRWHVSRNICGVLGVVVANCLWSGKKKCTHVVAVTKMKSGAGCY